MVKPVRRELRAQDRGRNLLMEATPEGIYLWRKGSRRAGALLLPWDAAWSSACKMEAKAAFDASGRKPRLLVKRGLL
jgi:hypothetical protein